jgi:hypothetical protein
VSAQITGRIFGLRFERRLLLSSEFRTESIPSDIIKSPPFNSKARSEESTSGIHSTPFYGIQAKCIGSKPVKGIRANIYKMASECQAYYNESANQYIFYIGNDLNISLLFADGSHQEDFFPDWILLVQITHVSII